MTPRKAGVALLLLCAAASSSPGFTQQPDSRSNPSLSRAQALFDARNFAAAAGEAQRVLEAEPDNTRAWKLAGLALQLSRRLGESEQTFSTAVAKFSRDADLWFCLSRVQYLNHKLKEARTSVEAALQLQPGHADAHTQLAMIFEARQEYDRALQSYDRAIELDRVQSRPVLLPLMNSGRLLMNLGRLQESLDRFSHAQELDPQSDQPLIWRSKILERLGKTREAREEYRRALALKPDSEAARLLDRIPERPGGGTTVRPALPATPIRFRDIASAAGLNFTLLNSASSRKYQVEPMTGGVAALDYDNDGWVDVYFVNGAELPSLQKTSERFWNRLFRNNHDGTFSDVTAAARVQGQGYGMGVAAADYDNDGLQDIFVAGVNKNILYRNGGDGAFTDVTARAGVEGIDPTRGKMWSVAAAWFDYDNDGKLDLFVVNYCGWNPSIDPYCGDLRPGYRTYCFPDRFEGLPSQLYHNNGDGTFTDVSAQSGIASHIGKGMGVAVADFDQDGRMDVFVANDTLPNFLFHNSGNGRFEEVGLRAGVALNETGTPLSSMGVDFRDYDDDGRPDLIVSALEGETFPLFRNSGNGFFTDETYSSGLGLHTVKKSGWSLGFYDFNNDGSKDLFSVNSHVDDNIELYNEQTYRQSNSVHAGLHNGKFQDVSAASGESLQTQRAHRGCAFADFDNDGRVDIVTTSLNDPVELLRNESPAANHWLMLHLVGKQSNRDGIGARIKIISESGVIRYNHVTTSVGYASSSDRRVHFGLGKDKRVKILEIRWPTGIVQVLKDLGVDRLVVIGEGTRATN
ncbi:MAG TPA: FG-GAP-like repeat-containing protein [Acidobacteriota bacterium]|jgi:tetratricopeptide (TPR) repeat protein